MSWHNEKDAANKRAETRSRLGLLRETHMQRTEKHHNPSIGGTRGLLMWIHYSAMDQYWCTEYYGVTANRAGCCTCIIRRWDERTWPYCMTGGAQRESLMGEDKLLLTICMFIYPKASYDGISAFIHSNGGVIYLQPQISEQYSDIV